MFLARERDGIDHPLHADRLAPNQLQLVVEEAEIEPGIVRHQRRIAEEGKQFIDALGKARLGRKERGAEAVHALGLGRHIAFRVVIGVEAAASLDPADHFDAADFHHAVPRLGIEPGGFGVEDDLPHLQDYPPKSRHLQGLLAIKMTQSK